MVTRPYSPSNGVTVGTGGPATWGGKLQIANSPNMSLLSTSLSRPATSLPSNAGSISFGSYSRNGAPLGKSASMGMLKARMVAEVRALGRDETVVTEDTVQQDLDKHEKMMVSLRSRAAKVEAENNKGFLTAYRNASGADRASGSAAQADARLDDLIRAAAERADRLRVQNEALTSEMTIAKEKFDALQAQEINRCSETEFATMSRFERSQRKIDEDKQDEELQRKRDDAQSKLAKISRQLQTELAELRDYTTLLQEYRELRLEKLEDTLSHSKEGSALHSSVRQMLRHGATRMMQKLQDRVPSLEAWMREVVLNMCHVENQIEDKEKELLQMRKKAVQPYGDKVQSIRVKTKEERVERLFTLTLDSAQSIRLEHHQKLIGSLEDQFGDPEQSGTSEDHSQQLAQNTKHARLSISEQHGSSDLLPSDSVSELREAEAEVLALRKLLTDTRQNIAAVVCNRMHQDEKRIGLDAAYEWGHFMLTLMVSQGFAKIIMKEVQKSAPHGQLTD